MDSVLDSKSSVKTPSRQSKNISSRLAISVIQPKGFPGLPEGWIGENEIIRSSCGKLNLFSFCLRRESPRSGKALIVVHGQGEHGGRYLHVPHYLQSVVDYVFCLDLRGHGRSEGIGGHVEQFDEYTRDVVAYVRHVHQILTEKFGKSEIHILGHSMGGLVSLRLLLSEKELPLKSAMISAPLLALSVKVPLWKDVLARAVNTVWGALQMGNEVNPKALSHDPAVHEIFEIDRLINAKATPRFYFSLLETMADTLEKTEGFEIPVLFLVPLEDAVVNPQATLDYVKRLGLPKDRIRIYEGFRHEIMNEGGDPTHPEITKERVFKDMTSWIQKNSK